MKLFFELELAYIFIALFFLVVTTIVTTRSFSPKNSFKKIQFDREREREGRKIFRENR